MARYSFSGTFRDGFGHVFSGGVVTAYLSGTSTLASIYTSATPGGTAVNTVSAASDGTFTLYVDNLDYDYEQDFDFVLSATNHESRTYSNISMSSMSPVLGTYTITGAKTISSHVVARKGVVYTKGTGGSMTFTGVFECGLFTVFSGFSAGDINFGANSVKEFHAEWFPTLALADAAATTAGKLLVVCQDCIISAATTLQSSILRIPGGSFTKSGSGTLALSGKFMNPDNGQCFFNFGAGDIGFGSGSTKFVCFEWTGETLNSHPIATAAGAGAGIPVLDSVVFTFAVDQGGMATFAVDAGVADGYVITLSPAPATLTIGMRISMKVTHANTVGNPTLNVNSLGAKTIIRNDTGSTLNAGDLQMNGWYGFWYDGTYFRLMNPYHTLTVSRVKIYLAGAQSIGNSATKVLLDTKMFDTDDIADVTTNHRIMPIKYGYYQINGSINWSSPGFNTNFYTLFFKNGTEVARSKVFMATGEEAGLSLSDTIYFDGSSDYLELYGLSSGGSVALVAGSSSVFLSMVGPF
jgi:hypothetical protein